MPWGDEGVTKLQYKLDSNIAWGAGGTPKTYPVTKAGIIRNLRMIQRGALTFSGAPSVSKFGPYNAYSQLELLANSQQSIFRTSGVGMGWVNMVKRGMEKGLPPVNTTLGSPLNVTDQDYAFDGTATAAPSNDTDWNWFLNLPVAQRITSLGGDVGMIPMSTENAQLQFSFTPSTASAASPYNIYTASATDNLANPYFHASNTVTVTAASLNLIREMYEAIENEQDFPNFDFVSQWLEETPQTFSGTSFTWKQNQDAGVLLRVIAGVFNNTSPFGIPTASLATADSLVLSYNTDIVKFKESGIEAVARQRDQLGFDLPQGVFMYDLLGSDLTLADVMNSYELPAIQLAMNYSSITLNSTINPKVIAQRLLPLRVA